MKNEKGEVMLESLIVYSVTIFLLFFILAIFSVLFQHWNIQTVANESVIRVAQTYNKHTKGLHLKSATLIFILSTLYFTVLLLSQVTVSNIRKNPLGYLAYNH